MKLRIFAEPQQGADYATLLRVAKAAEGLDLTDLDHLALLAELIPQVS
jgi:hypothetical protein